MSNFFSQLWAPPSVACARPPSWWEPGCPVGQENLELGKGVEREEACEDPGGEACRPVEPGGRGGGHRGTSTHGVAYHWETS